MVAYRANDIDRGLVSLTDCRCAAERRNSHRQADHLQSCPCRQHRQIAPTHATRTEIYKKMQSHTPHQSHQYCRQSQHTSTSRRGRRDAFGRLGNGHHSGFIRTCYSNAHRTFHKLHTHGETRTGTQGLANGSGRVQAAIPIQRIIEDHHHRQRP